MRRRLAIVLALVLFAVAGVLARPYWRGLAFVIRAAHVQGPARWLADLDAEAPGEHGLTIPLQQGPIRARLYEPGRRPQRTVLLVSGLHPAGINEPRLVDLSRQLASSGLAVVTPDIPELSRFEITPAVPDEIEQAAVWLATQSDLAGDRRIGLMGISFSGGLAIVAAGRPALAGHLAYVLSYGGYDDLPRVLRYLCTGEEPSLQPGAPPIALPPHDYGVAVILLNVADRLVPPDQVAPLRDAVRRYLWASALDTVDAADASTEFAALRQVASSLPEPSATLLKEVNARDVHALGERLLPVIDDFGRASDLSPSASPKPRVPVFLLHGLEDNVIPAEESEFLAHDLEPHVPVRLLLSREISHASADRPLDVRGVWRLAIFWGRLLKQ
jgi:dienelactone hydrolase